MSIRQTVKRLAPPSVVAAYVRLNSKKEGLIAFNYDKRRFLKHNAKRTGGKSTQPQLEGRLVFHAHALEKGLSHKELRLGFGKSALRHLAVNMKKYLDRNYTVTSGAYINSLSVLGEYIKVHEKEKFNIDYLNAMFSDDILVKARGDKSGLGGVYIVPGDEKRNTHESNFKELFTNRWSVREYSNEPVDRERIDEVLDIARKTPSICNRQSSRTTVIYDKEAIAAVLALQGGITGYELPPALLMITTDTSAFVDVNERNQVFIDGGLYAMSVLLGLEYASLAACPLNAMMSVSRDKKMRKILNIPASENIIMFISVGNFLETNKVPKSFRYSASESRRVV